MTCGRYHEGRCLAGTVFCYQCGQPGHIKRDCFALAPSMSSAVQSTTPQHFQGRGSQMMRPERPQTIGPTPVSVVQPSAVRTDDRQRGQPGRPRTHARVFALTEQEAQATPDVVTGMLTIFGQDAHILIDPGSTHSFISYTFSIHADKELSPLDYSLVVATPLGDSLLAENV